MPQTPKKKPVIESDDTPDDATWAEDQKERGYYYDDAHGYEVYEGERDEDDEVEESRREAN